MSGVGVGTGEVRGGGGVDEAVFVSGVTTTEGVDEAMTMSGVEVDEETSGVVEEVSEIVELSEEESVGVVMTTSSEEGVDDAGVLVAQATPAPSH